MSRLIVKNLANSVTEKKLRKTFGEKGIITDVQLKFTKDGKFRHFGFVGFKNPEDAQAAKDFLDGTFLNATKIQVEICSDLGDVNKPKSWSKYAEDSTAFKNKNKSESIPEKPTKEEKKKKKKEQKSSGKTKELVEKHKDDPLFAEFLESHGKSVDELVGKDCSSDEESEAEGNNEDADESAPAEGDKGKELEEKIAKEANKKISDSDYLKSITGSSAAADTEEGQVVKKERVKMQKVIKQIQKNTLFTVKVRGLAFKHKKKDIKQFFGDLKPKSVRLCPKVKGIAYVGFNTEKEMKQALHKNKSFLEGKRLLVTMHSLPKNNTEDESKEKWNKQEESLKNEETIAESGCIFVRNLAYTTSEADIEPLFSKYGPLTEINVPIDRMSRKMKGFACVTYMIPENAVRAYTDLDGKVFQGRMLHLLPGKTKKSFSEMAEEERLSFKQKQVLKQKAQSGSSHNWNSLFLGQNAVVDAMAKAYNTSKEQVLDPESSDSIAVRLALGETQLVQDTKQFLEQNGVSLDAFNQAPKSRSKCVIIAKNLPAGTSSEELRELFAAHGELGRLVLPPSGVTAIIEFGDPSEAKTAFTKLAYTKFKHLPLYLEWAPEETFTNKAFVSTNKKSNQAQGDIKTDTPGEEAELIKEEAEEETLPEPENDTTLFVKNLNFTTTDDALKEHFAKCGKILSSNIAKKKDSKTPGKMLSMGYGFLQFIKKSSADKALKTLQHSMLEGHAIELKRSNRTLSNDVATSRKKANIGKQTGSKIIVRNIPFQANQHEIRDLFKVFGELKAVRLPRKMVGTGPHRGFGFVDFVTKSDAKRAFEALCQSTHLYGRRLVLEWAAPEESVEDLRKRTAQHFHEDKQSKKSRKSVAVMDLSNKEGEDED